MNVTYARNQKIHSYEKDIFQNYELGPGHKQPLQLLLVTPQGIYLKNIYILSWLAGMVVAYEGGSTSATPDFFASMLPILGWFFLSRTWELTLVAHREIFSEPYK